MIARAIAVAASLIFLAVSARELVRRGGPVRARTIVSHSGFAAHDSEDVMLLLRRARNVIPRGAGVAVFDQKPRSNHGFVATIAEGQMPAHRIVIGSSDPTAEYVVAFHDSFADSRYAVVWRGSEGTILRRR
jgi:hypothetical protein